MWEWRTIARSPTPGRDVSGTADGEEVETAVEVTGPQGEVRGGDRRVEPAVEGLRQPQLRMDGVPAQSDRDLVRAQLAGVEEAEQLDRVEVGLAELAKLRRPVLAHVPG